MNAISERTRKDKISQYRNFNDYVMEEFRKHPEDLDLYVDLALEDFHEENHVPFLLLALRTVAEAKGVDIPNLMNPADLSARSTLDLAELRDILHALGYRLSAKPVDTAKSK